MKYRVWFVDDIENFKERAAEVECVADSDVPWKFFEGRNTIKMRDIVVQPGDGRTAFGVHIWQIVYTLKPEHLKWLT